MAEQVQYINIRDITPVMKQVNLKFIVLEVGPPRRTKDGHFVRNTKIADKSGSISLSVWDEVGECIQPADICHLTNGYSTVRHLQLTVVCGRISQLRKVGEFCMLFSEIPDMSAHNPELAQYAENVPYNGGSDYRGGNNGNGGGRFAGGGGSSGFDPTAPLGNPPFHHAGMGSASMGAVDSIGASASMESSGDSGVRTGAHSLNPASRTTARTPLLRTPPVSRPTGENQRMFHGEVKSELKSEPFHQDAGATHNREWRRMHKNDRKI